MSALVRGAKNAFRKFVRTISITLILAISIGLALIMLVASRAVQSHIETVKATVGNTITVTPAGSQGFEGGGEPLTDAQMMDVKSVAHVTSVRSVLLGRLTPTEDTSLASAIDPGTLGNRRGNNAQRGGTNGNVGAQPNGTFTIPIMVTGTSDPASLKTQSVQITSGELFAADSDEDVAVVGKELATKNNLSVGSTFTAYTKTITVKGIFDAGNQFANAGAYMPLKSLQRLASQPGEISSATVNVDSLENVDATASAVKTKLGEDKADVVSNADQSKQALEPLESIKNISFYGLIGSLVAGAVITLLSMIMIVRERRREIGVLKAIGASNFTIIMQFISESLVLTSLAGVVGIILGFAFSNPVLSALVASSASTTNEPTGGPPQGGPGGGGFRAIAQFGGTVQNNINDIHAIVSYDIILYGILAAFVIAIVGSAIPAWIIAKVRPAEVMRGE